MSFGGPTKYCPRCNTLLPAQATICGTCGMQFSAPSGPGYGSQYGGPGTPGGWPQSQPGYPSPAQPGYGGYPPGQPGPAGYAPAAFAPPPKKSKTGLIVTLLVVVVLAGAGTAGFFYLRSHTTSPSSPFFDRHGLQSNVPLPDNVTYAVMKTLSQTQNNVTTTADIWGWQVNGSKQDAVQQFYQNNLSNNGWTHIKSIPTSNGEKALTACQSGQLLVVATSDTEIPVTDNGTVVATVTAPSGGSALAIELSTSADAVALICSGNSTP